jgi:hypothetical protein
MLLSAAWYNAPYRSVPPISGSKLAQIKYNNRLASIVPQPNWAEPAGGGTSRWWEKSLSKSSVDFLAGFFYFAYSTWNK